jgi:hypothetical protein
MDPGIPGKGIDLIIMTTILIPKFEMLYILHPLMPRGRAAMRSAILPVFTMHQMLSLPQERIPCLRHHKIWALLLLVSRIHQQHCHPMCA